MALTEADIARLLEEGLKHYAIGEPSQALEAWYKVLEVDGENARALEYVEYVRKTYRIEVQVPTPFPIEASAVVDDATAVVVPPEAVDADGSTAVVDDVSSVVDDVSSLAPAIAADQTALSSSAAANGGERWSVAVSHAPAVADKPSIGGDWGAAVDGDWGATSSADVVDVDLQSSEDPPVDAAAQAQAEADAAAQAQAEANAAAQAQAEADAAAQAQAEADAAALAQAEADAAAQAQAEADAAAQAQAEADAAAQAQAEADAAAQAQAEADAAAQAQAEADAAAQAQAEADAAAQAQAEADAAAQAQAEADAAAQAQAEADAAAQAQAEADAAAQAQAEADAAAQAQAEADAAAQAQAEADAAAAKVPTTLIEASWGDIVETGVVPDLPISSEMDDADDGPPPAFADDLLSTPDDAPVLAHEYDDTNRAPREAAPASFDAPVTAIEPSIDASTDSGTAESGSSEPSVDAAAVVDGELRALAGAASVDDAASVESAPSSSTVDPTLPVLRSVNVAESNEEFLGVHRTSKVSDSSIVVNPHEEATRLAGDASSSEPSPTKSSSAGRGSVDEKAAVLSDAKPRMLRFDSYDDEPPVDETIAAKAVVVEPVGDDDKTSPTFENPLAKSAPLGPPPAEAVADEATATSEVVDNDDQGSPWDTWSGESDSVDLDTTATRSMFDDLLQDDKKNAPVPHDVKAPRDVTDDDAFALPKTDPVADGSAEASAESSVEQDAPPESECTALMQGARELFSLGDFSGSLELVEKVLALEPENLEARDYLEKNEETLLKMYESKLGDLTRAPRLMTSPDEVIWMNLHHRAGFILSQVDGMLTYEDLAAISGMSRLETYRILADLVQNAVITS